MVDSKINAKKYFLPVYAIFMILTPTIVTLMQGYLNASDGQSLFEAIHWRRVPAFYALFGLIWPLTIVISPAFFLSVKRTTGFTFFQALSATGPLATKAIIAYILFAIAWIGPIVAFAAALYLHKEDVTKQAEDPDEFSWVDYLASFI